MNRQLSYLVPLGLLTAPAAAQAGAGGQASIPSVVITVENAQPSRGMLLTPPWIGLHDGTFDTYDGGSPANVPLGGNEIEAMAEDGNNGPLAMAFGAQQPNAPQRAGLPGPAGPLAPGDRVSVTLNVDPFTDRFFSYASMIIPSNDTFIANGSPVAHPMFNNTGQFVGTDFIVSGDEARDAGTEVNDEIAGNVAFLQQGGPNTGTTENGVVAPSPGFAAPGSLAYPDGVLNYPVFGNGDFNDADDRLFGVRFRFVDLGGLTRFDSVLSPEQEIQADLVTSDARGEARLRSFGAQRVQVGVRYRDMTGPIQMAHLHLGQAGTNGPVVANLSAGIAGSAASGIVGMTVRASDLTGPLAGADVLDLVNEMAAGNVYINLHTAQFPGGELRGQVSLAD